MKKLRDLLLAANNEIAQLVEQNRALHAHNLKQSEQITNLSNAYNELKTTQANLNATIKCLEQDLDSFAIGWKLESERWERLQALRRQYSFADRVVNAFMTEGMSFNATVPAE